ncbi:hypothetical protein D9M68_500790 [compost metagenome]
MSKTIYKRRFFVDLVCYAYFLLFLYAAVSKLIDYESSELRMAKSPIITEFATILVWLVPAVEIIIALMLVIPKTIMLGLYAALALMSMFTAYIIAILNFSDTIPCSCGGVLEQLSWTEHLVFNLTFIIMAMMAILLQVKTDKHKA